MSVSTCTTVQMRPDGSPSVQAHGENCTGFGSGWVVVVVVVGIISSGYYYIWETEAAARGGGDDTRRGGLGETGRAATLQHLSHRRLISLNVELTRTRGLCDIHTHTHLHTRTHADLRATADKGCALLRRLTVTVMLRAYAAAPAPGITAWHDACEVAACSLLSRV